MLNESRCQIPSVRPMETIDRVVVAYVTLPLAVFLIGWFRFWVAIPLLALMAYSLTPLATVQRFTAEISRHTTKQIWLALAAGFVWTLFGGTGHWFFANSDWHIRDAVLHDLVASPWPVGYGIFNEMETLLRAPVAYFLPAALIGKAVGLPAAHIAMETWTAIGVSLFLMQILSEAPSKITVALKIFAIVILFSGLDIVGQLLQGGPRFRAEWNITSHLEWWARIYQYSSMTTQLFWVPNHAIGAWLTVGLISRHEGSTAIDALIPLMIVAAMLWSPLSALGLIPIAAFKAISSMLREHSFALLHPRVWLPSLIVGIVVMGFLGLDPGGIPRTWTLNQTGEGPAMGIARQAQFFLFEAGLIGFSILWIRRSTYTILALVILAILPVVSFGAANDFAMRASIPSLAVLCIAACRALCVESGQADVSTKKITLVFLLAIGAITPLQEFARAMVVPAWAANLQATLVGADCGRFPAHYVARTQHEVILLLMKRPNRLTIGDTGPASCKNPAETALERGDQK